MSKTYIKYAFSLIIAVSLLGGCVVTGQIAERQGTKAFLQKDYATAQAKYTEAIAEGDKNAQYHMAVMYADGLGVEQDYAKAAELLKLSAAQGLTDAQLMLGLFNVYGDGVPLNPTKGAELISQAAEAGNDVAMYYLANLYAAGLGVNKDLPTALEWMTKAHKAGFPFEEENLTIEYMEALYVE